VTPAREPPQQRSHAARFARLSWVLWGLCLLLCCLALTFLMLSVATPLPYVSSGFRGSSVALAIPLSTVGAIVASRRPANPIGWLLCAAGIGYGLQTLAEEYRVYALFTTAGAFPLGPHAAWLASWLWVPLLGLVTVYVFLLFPDGKLPSPRWRPVAWVAGVALAAASTGFAFAPGPLNEFPIVPNPFGLRPGAAILRQAATVGMVIFALTTLASGASLLLRLRRARAAERQQLKWFVYAATVSALAFGVAVGLVLVGRPSTVALIVSVLAFAGLPVVVGIAILRYRLYDIDRIIHRTLVYGLVTALLGGIYAGAVLLLGHASGGVTDDPPSWAVAGATLAVAALFQPARHRIQTMVDRRFNRRRYNAARTVEAFSVRLRDQVDLDTLSAELVAVVDETMEPTTVSLWLSAPAKHSTR
jgi:MFS family permease